MVRWEPGTRERLQAAALDLFDSRGFEKTTAAEIAQAAGLTERTFFRYFTDKREVLFDGEHRLERTFTAAVAGAPPDASALEMVSLGLAAAGDFFADERRDWSRRRQRVISEHPALQERELLKLAGLAAAVAAAMRDRGIPEPAATLAAESAVTVFGVAFATWIAEGEQRSFAGIGREILGQMGSIFVQT
jgi:AcrR family transcriptional regulator